MATLLKALRGPQSAAEELDSWIEATQRKSLLRFITCGSVDDGKSTLIGRLLHDSRQLTEDQLSALASDSLKSGTQGEDLDFALLVDGLSAEREQGITIDVAYRFFATARRKFIVADTPGHEQYTRNMVTGASSADLAVILVDAQKGVLTQTRRHSFIAHLLGIRNIVLAVNKMDLVDYDEAVFADIVAGFAEFAAEAGIEDFTAIPLSGLKGDNVVERSAALPWHDGPSLLEHLETVPATRRETADAPFRMPIQAVSRPDPGFRGYAGRIASGRIRAGEAVVLFPAVLETVVERIVTFDGDLDEAVAGQSVILTFRDEIDCARGDVVTSAHAVPELVHRIGATLVWMSPEELLPRRSYWLKIGTSMVSARIAAVRSVTNIENLAEEPGRPLGLNEIGQVEIDLDQRILGVRYAQNRRLGGFILIDKLTRATVAAGLIEELGAAERSRASQAEERAIRWVTGRRRDSWAAAAADRLRALGHHHVVILDEAAIGAFGAPDMARTAVAAARLLAGAGAQVFITLGVTPKGVRLSELIDSETQDPGGDEWVI